MSEQPVDQNNPATSADNKARDCADVKAVEMPKGAVEADGRESLAPIRRKLENWIALSEAEKRDLGSLPCLSLSFGTGETYGEREQERRTMAIIVSGHMFAYDVLPNGNRHISGFYYPGDLLNYHSFAVGRTLFEYVAVGPVSLCLVDEAAFVEFLEAGSGISHVLMLMETARYLFLTDRFRAATRLEGEQRVLHLLLEMKAAEELFDAEPHDRMMLPFTQEQIADMMGLTPVYVSKMMTRLEKSGIIERDRKLLRFHNRLASERETGFVNRYQQITEWRRPRL